MSAGYCGPDFSKGTTKVFQHFKTSLHGCRAASYSLYCSPLWSKGLLVVWFTLCVWGKQRPEPNEAGVNMNNVAHRARISRTAWSKTAKLIRVIYSIAAGAGRALSRPQGRVSKEGSEPVRGLELAYSSWRMVSSSLCATFLPTNTAWPEWEWRMETQIIWAEVTSEDQNRAKRAKAKP